MPPTSTSKQRITTAARAFTLIELLVAIVIIFVLITTAFVALRSARKSAGRTETLNALRQMGTAYNSYHAEHKGRLLPGYLDPNILGTDLDELNITAKLGGTKFPLDEEDTGPYVWRLAPYLDHAWDTYMVDYRSSQIESQMTTEYGTGSGAAGEIYGPGTAANDNQLGIAELPSFGLNSIYLGGDSLHGDPTFSPWDTSGPVIQPNPNTVAATRFNQVKSPTKIIVFAPSAHQPPYYIEGAPLASLRDQLDAQVRLGYFELRAPFAEYDPATQTAAQPQWSVQTAGQFKGQAALPPGVIGGVPIDRLGDEHISVVHLDGSTGTELLGRIEKDMSRWSPFAVSGN